MWLLGASKIVLFFNFIQISCGALSLTNFENAHTDLTRSIRCIFSNNFLLINENLFIYTRFSSSSLENRYFSRDVLDVVAHELDNITFTLNFNQPVHFRSYLHYQLILVDGWESVQFLYENLLQHGTANLSYTIIYMANVDNPQHGDVKKVFALFWQLSILNAGMILRPSGQDLLMVSYFPFRSQRCQVVEPVVVNRFDGERAQWSAPIYFPQKLQNFYGCKLNCATWEEMPYLETEHDANGGIVGFRGIEGNLMVFISNNLNFSVGLYYMTHREILESFNDTGLIFNEIFDKHADYAMGAFFYKPDITGTAPFSQTNTYYLSQIYLVTAIFDVYSTYEKLAYPFRSLLWLTIGVILLVGCVVILASGWSGRRVRAFICGNRNAAPYHNMFAIAVGAPSAVPLPRRNFARFLLAVWLLATLVLRSAYQSGMYQLLRDDIRRDLPQTIASVVEQHYIIAIRPENVRFMSSLPEVKHVRFLNTTEMDAFSDLAVSKERMAIITPYEYFGYFRKINSLSHRLHLVRERVYTQQLSFYVRRNSYLVDVLNEEIAKAHTYGYSDQWLREFIGAGHKRPIVNGFDGAADDESDSQVNILSMKELEAIFMILIWLHLCGVGIFVIEVVWTRLRILIRLPV